jgi:hypothetical protein
MTPETHVQHCAALICAYIADDDEGCDTLRDTPYFSSRMRQSAQGGRLAVMLFRYSLLARYGYTAHRRSTHTPTR